MLGVWQGVPYIFADFMRVLRGAKDDEQAAVSTESPYYRGYLLFTALVPMTLLVVDRPVWVIIAYSVAGAFFMPFLAGTLLYLNNRRRWVTTLRNGWLMNGLLVAALLIFGYLCINEIIARL